MEQGEQRATRLHFVAKSLLLALVVTLAWQQPFPRLFGLPITPYEIVFPFAALAWLVFRLKSRLAVDKFHFLTAAFFLTVAVACFFSPQPAKSLTKLAGVAELVISAMIAYDIIRDDRDLKHISFAWLAAATVPVVVGLATLTAFYVEPTSEWLQFTKYHHGAAPLGNYPRLSSTFVSASMFCNYLTATLSLLFIAQVRNWISPNLVIAAVLAVGICAAFTVSVALGGFFLVAGLIAWKLLYEKRRAVSLAFFAGGILVSLLFLLASVPSRSMVWADAVQTIFAHPVFGAGLDMPVANVIFQNTDGTNSDLTDAHNTFLSVWAQNGVFAFLMLIGLCVFVVRRGLRAAADPTVFVLLIAFIAAFLYDGLTGSFEDTRHLWILIGLITGKRLGQ